MRTTFLNTILAAAVVFGVGQPCVAQSDWVDELSAVEIGGVVGLSEPEQVGCIAVWIPVPEELALDGLRWYNNDDDSSFPQVLVQSGSANYPVAVKNAFTVAEGVFGETLGWSEVLFSEPVASSTEGLYVIFKLPVGRSVIYEGDGGGPAMGYTSSTFGYTGWMSADGVDWIKLNPEFGFAVSPVFVDRESGMYVKSAAQSGDAGDVNQQAERFRTELGRAYPNPFNPQTTISFSLKSDGPVSLAIYSVRGELVRSLVSGRMSAGPHEVIWNGRDQSEASVASGVYFAHLVAGPVSMTQRLVLVQ